MKIRIGPNGTVTFIYHDDLKPLMNEGVTEIRRASHVEPTSNGKWTADLRPVQGPILGPFEFREEALRAEIEWLELRLDEIKEETWK